MRRVNRGGGAALVLAGVVALAAGSAAGQVTIDDFAGDQGPLFDPGVSSSAASPGGAILGTERDMRVVRRSGAGTVTGEVTVTGELTFTAPASTAGVLLVDWDGTDGDPLVLDTDGLGGADLTAGGHNALAITVDAAGAGTVVHVEVWDMAGNRGVSRRVLPLIPAPIPLVFAYSDFSGSVSFSTVGAVRLRIEGEAVSATFSSPFATSVGGVTSIAAAKVDAIAVDVDADGVADPGDTIEYTIPVSAPAAGATGVDVTDTLDGNTTLVASSVTVSPLARDDAYDCISNVGIVVPAASGVLTNDTDLDGGAALVPTFFQPTTAEGGTVGDAGAGDGSFTYIPPVGFVGTDFFSYSVLDDEGDTDFASVAVTCANPIWFVDDTAAGGGNGTLAAPFDSLAGVQGASDPDGPGHCIHLQGPGAADYTGGLVLEDDQLLIGTGAGGTLADRCGIGAVPPHTSPLPVLSTMAASRPTIVNAGGHGITLAADNSIRGVDVDDTSGAGIFGNFSTLFVSDVSITGTGQALDLANGTLNAVFDTLAATATGAANPGIELDTVGGSLTAATTTLTEAGGAIGGNGIDVQNSAGAASFDFGNTTVTKNVAAGKGINLLSNSMATFTFDSLSVTTTNSTGLDAETSGTLNVTGAANAVTSGQGTAVRIKSTTIGASGVTFRSVSSSGGSATGIILDGTGTTAGFTVTGDGSTAGSGGTIANKTGADGSTTTGIGIFLNNTMDPSFARMQLNDFSNFAIRGTSVSGFTLTNSVINGTNGSSTTADEGSVSFFNLTGSASLTSNTIAGGHEDNIVVINDTGTLNRMTVTGGTIGLNATATGNDGITVESRSSATLNLTVNSVSFLGARGDMVQCNAINASTMDCVIKDNTFANAHTNIASGGGGITISGGGATANINLTYEVSATTAGSGATPATQKFTGAKGFAITANAVSGAGTMTGTIRNNDVGTSGVAGSGSTEGGGILAAAAGTVTHTVTIDNNRVRRIGQGGGTASGIDIVANVNGTPRPQMNATVINNDVAELEGSGGFAGMNLTLAGSGTENGILCMDVRNNVFDASGGTFAGSAIFSQQLSAAANFNYPGYTSPPLVSASANGEFAFLCSPPGSASADLNTFLTTTRGNTLTDGPFIIFPGVDAGLNCGTTGTGTSCP